MRTLVRFLSYVIGVGCVIVALFFTVTQYGTTKTVIEVGLIDPWFVRTVTKGAATHELRASWSALAAVGALLWLGSGFLPRRRPPADPAT